MAAGSARANADQASRQHSFLKALILLLLAGLAAYWSIQFRGAQLADAARQARQAAAPQVAAQLVEALRVPIQTAYALAFESQAIKDLVLGRDEAKPLVAAILAQAVHRLPGADFVIVNFVGESVASAKGAAQADFTRAPAYVRAMRGATSLLVGGAPAQSVLFVSVPIHAGDPRSTQVVGAVIAMLPAAPLQAAMQTLGERALLVAPDGEVLLALRPGDFGQRFTLSHFNDRWHARFAAVDAPPAPQADVPANMAPEVMLDERHFWQVHQALALPRLAQGWRLWALTETPARLALTDNLLVGGGAAVLVLALLMLGGRLVDARLRASRPAAPQLRLPYMEGINLDEGMSRSGNLERYLDNLSRFLNDHFNTGRRLASALADADWTEAESIVQRCRMDAEAVGALTLMDKAARLERVVLARAPAEQIAERFGDFVQHLGKSAVSIRKGLHKSGHPPPQLLEVEPDQPAAWHPDVECDSLVALLANGDTGASAYFMSHRHEIASVLPVAEFERLQAALDAEDFGTALTLLQARPPVLAFKPDAPASKGAAQDQQTGQDAASPQTVAMGAATLKVMTSLIALLDAYDSKAEPLFMRSRKLLATLIPPAEFAALDQAFKEGDYALAVEICRKYAAT